MNPLVLTYAADSCQTPEVGALFLHHENASKLHNHTTGLYGRKITECDTTLLISGEDMCVLSRPVQLYLLGLYNRTCCACTISNHNDFLCPQNRLTYIDYIL